MGPGLPGSPSLVGLLLKNQVDNRLIDFCVRTLELADGRMPIKELERRTGFTRRYLDQLFSRHVGLSPKTPGRDLPFPKVLPEMGSEPTL